MKIPIILYMIICCCLPSMNANAQNRRFELSNPQSIELDESKLQILTSGYWRVFKDEFENRGRTSSNRVNVSMCYFADGRFFYNGSDGTWTILEGRYINHQFDDQDAAARNNFGGIFSVIQMGDSSLTLQKLLTTSHDMQRTLYLKSSAVLTPNEQPISAGPYFYEGVLDQPAIDSISSMDADELFDAGFTVIGNGVVHIISPDSLYVIKVKGNHIK